jgi:prepilin-type processing-associated H-X9-DG protein
MIAKQRASTTGFTLTELLVLIGVGSVLAGVLLADLTQARTKLLQQACAANLKHWGMAFDMYAQDYNNRLFYDVAGNHWDDVSFGTRTNVYLRYLGGDNSTAAIRNMRICPARVVTMTQSDVAVSLFHNYQMPIGTYKKGLSYANADAGSSINPFFDPATVSYFPSLTFLPQPSSFLLLIECRGNTLRCGGLVSATTTSSLGIGGDLAPAVNRHGGGGVNCLFGDFHVEFVSSTVLTNQDAISCFQGNPWFRLN